MNIFEKFNQLSVTERAEIYKSCLYQGSLLSNAFLNTLADAGKGYYITYRSTNFNTIKDLSTYVNEPQVHCNWCNNENSYFELWDFQENFVVYFEYRSDPSFNSTPYIHYIDKVVSIEEIETYLSSKFTKFKKVTTPQIGLLNQNSDGSFRVVYHNLDSRRDLNLDDNYNEDLQDLDRTLIKTLISKKKSMTILHGIPGTGKTTYLRYLTSVLAGDLRFIYLPPNLANILGEPHFIGNLELFKNAVVIIEDAENVLLKRETRSQAVSNLLNISDGFLSDIFNIHFVFTFNADIAQIDKALLRKGRLTLKYEFKPLSDEKTKALCEKLGTSVDNNKTLAEIYNADVNIINETQKKRIGFRE